MTEKKLEPSEVPAQALQIIQLLIEFSCPKDSSKVSNWLKHVELLQTLLSNIWQSDPTGNTMVQCLNFFYNRIATHATPVSPAVWCILGLVGEDKISEFVNGILSDSAQDEGTKIQNVLAAIIEGLCQCGPFIPSLQGWIFVIVRGLEAKKCFPVLINVSEKVTHMLLKTLMVPVFRPLTYPVFRQFLYPVMTPHIFFKVIDTVPQVMSILQKDMDNSRENNKMCIEFFGLIKILLDRFPSSTRLEPRYLTIEMMLEQMPDAAFKSNGMILWDLKLDRNQFVSIERLFNNEIPVCVPYKGLINQGNTCFMNSVLQLLYMTTRFRKELLDKELDPSERAANDIQQLFALMQESKRTVLELNGVIDSTLPHSFQRGHQQDSSEYLIYLLDTLHENENKIIRRKKQRHASRKVSERRKDSDEGAAPFKAPEEDTIVDRLFGGISLSTTICSSCNKSFPKKDAFRDLQLPMPDHHGPCDLQELVNESFRPEYLISENMYDCASCGTKRNATRKQVILKAPQHLILTLKLFRFDSERKRRLKLHSKLKNANALELPVYDSSQLQTGLVAYNLKGVVLHSGSSLDGGHYFSSAVDGFGNWYIFNDSVVTVARSNWNSAGGTPYILILRQSDIADPPRTPLPSNLQLMVNRDNQKFLAEKKSTQGTWHSRKKDYEEDRDEPPSDGNGFSGTPGPSLVF